MIAREGLLNLGTEGPAAVVRNWVRENIEDFGGDPDNVIITGLAQVRTRYVHMSPPNSSFLMFVLVLLTTLADRTPAHVLL